MKIKKRLRILILVIILLPVSSLLAIFLYHYITSPERFLMKGYKEIRALGEIELSDNVWNVIESRLKGIPSGVEVAVFYDGKIISSNMPEIKPGLAVQDRDLFRFIHSSSNKYDYQFQEIIVPGTKPDDAEFHRDKPRRRRNSVLFISRMNISDSGLRESITGSFFFPGIVFMFIFETIAVIMVFQIFSSLSASVTFVEKTVQEIADGGIDREIDTSKIPKKADEIILLADNLEKMRRSLKDNVSRRQKFIMGISHDLRTPVALIKGYTEAINDGVVNDMDSMKKSLEIIYTKATVLENMINDLIDYVKLDGNEWLLSLEDTFLKPVLTEFADGIVSLSDFYKRKITASVNITDAIQIPLDRNLFDRVLENLFSNAVRYSAEGDSIAFSAEEKDNSVIIKLSDTGTGIHKDDLPHIFDLFYRGSSSRRESGSGIGLAVVKTVTDAMNWDIKVFSEQGKGTEFVITVPLSQEKSL